MTRRGSGDPVGFTVAQITVLCRHHSHDGIECCGCGEPWPCLATTMIVDQLQAWVNEHGGKDVVGLNDELCDQLVEYARELAGQNAAIVVEAVEEGY